MIYDSTHLEKIWNHSNGGDNACLVFGYGSIVHLQSLSAFLGKKKISQSDYRYCNLVGFRRAWNIAMDNSHDIPGYKWFRDTDSQKRPDLRVAFLNIYESRKNDFINGVLFRVTKNELARMQKRERNYDLLEISDRLNISVSGKAYVFIGKKEAEKRFVQGLRANKTVISADYKKLVEQGFKSVSRDYFETYIQTTDEPAVPVRKLETVYSDTFYPEDYRAFFRK
ncbi:MAG: gamma-glutamylcyclotransferase [Desulfobulbaceae bacterium]|nr:gamma-glutamylcyclotransferase [Desulfobulbaceae bacterium]